MLARFEAPRVSSFTRGDSPPSIEVGEDLEAGLNTITQLINWMSSWFEWFIQSLHNFIGELLNNLAAWMSDVINQLTFNILNLFNSIATAVDAAFRTIVDVFNGFISTVQGLVDNIIGTLQSLYEQAIGLISQAYNAFVANLSSLWDFFTGRVSALFTQTVNRILEVASAIIARAGEAFQAIQNTLAQAFETVTNEATGVIRSAGERLNEFLDVSLLGAEGLVAAIRERLGEIGTQFADAAVTVLEGITGLTGEVKDGLSPWIESLAKEIGQWADPAEAGALVNRIRSLTAGEASVAEFRDFVRVGWQSVVPPSGMWRGVFVSIAAIAASVPSVLGAAQIAAEPVLQEMRATFPTTLLSPGDILAAWRRGQVTKEHALDVIRRQGYATSDAELLFDITEQVPAEIDLVSMWHRDIITEGELDRALRQRGFDTAWQNRLKAASHFLPPVQDLITMAVREVFSPSIRTELRLDEGFPERFAEEAAKQGIGRQVAGDYWAAHWSLPSARQGFEMVHRGAITEGRLDTLLRALDVMPVWREPLKAIAFSPFTRVDIRRMHRLGILDREAVVGAHKEIGYDEEKAELLTRFVERLNRNAPTEDDIELGRLSRAAVLGFYDDGLLTRERASELLVDLGHTPEAASLYISSVDQEDERRERSEETSLILDMAAAGTLSFEEAQDRLGAIGLETREQEKAITKLVRVQQRRTKLPTLAQGGRFLKEGIITREAYRLLLARLGYAPDWIAAFEELTVRGIDASED